MIPVRYRRVQLCPSLPRRPLASPERRPTGPARPRPPPQRPPLSPTRGRSRRRHHHRLPLRHRSRRAPGRPRPQVCRAVRVASTKAYVILDGTLLPIDRTGRLLWASSALPGAVHDVRATREHGIIDALAKAGLGCWADKGHQGAGGTVRLLAGSACSATRITSAGRRRRLGLSGRPPGLLRRLCSGDQVERGFIRANTPHGPATDNGNGPTASGDDSAGGLAPRVPASPHPGIRPCDAARVDEGHRCALKRALCHHRTADRKSPWPKACMCQQEGRAAAGALTAGPQLSGWRSK
ncbi:hypothetical protein QFZ32_005887 [Streptomyces canus]|nr:hypothetical protein [Streptomyces canus]